MALYNYTREVPYHNETVRETERVAVSVASSRESGRGEAQVDTGPGPHTLEEPSSRDRGANTELIMHYLVMHNLHHNVWLFYQESVGICINTTGLEIRTLCSLDRILYHWAEGSSAGWVQSLQYNTAQGKGKPKPCAHGTETHHLICGSRLTYGVVDYSSTCIGNIFLNIFWQTGPLQSMILGYHVTRLHGRTS